MESALPTQKIIASPPKPTIVPRFAVDDENGYSYLEEYGYVVFRDVATPEEVTKGIELMWDYMEGLQVGIKRDDPSTWGVPGWPNSDKGIILGNAVGHSSFLWFARSLPSVQKIFSKIWSTNQVVTSFDGFGIQRPFEYNDEWKTKGGWYHLDQNGHHKPTKQCVQGLLNFYPSGIHDGGLVVIPKSHTIFNQIFHSRPHLKEKNDFIYLAYDEDLWQIALPRAGLSPIKVCAEPGDFLLWDSRTIHCNTPADTSREIPAANSFLPPRRLVAYVCMIPKARLNPDIIAARRNFYENGHTTSHWPDDNRVAEVRKNKQKDYQPLPLTESQRNLIPI